MDSSCPCVKQYFTWYSHSFKRCRGRLWAILENREISVYCRGGQGKKGDLLIYSGLSEIDNQPFLTKKDSQLLYLVREMGESRCGGLERGKLWFFFRRHCKLNSSAENKFLHCKCSQSCYYSLYLRVWGQFNGGYLLPEQGLYQMSQRHSPQQQRTAS